MKIVLSVGLFSPRGQQCIFYSGSQKLYWIVSARILVCNEFKVKKADIFSLNDFCRSETTSKLT